MSAINQKLDFSIRNKSVTKWIVALLILAGYAYSTPGQTFNGWLLAIALGATALENIGIWGTDNLLVPLFAAISLSALM